MSELEQALAYHREIFDVVHQIKTSGTVNDAAKRTIAAAITPGLWEHFKSTEAAPKFYAVYYVGFEQDTNHVSVSYTALYPPHAGIGTSRDLLHPEHGFLTPIKREGYEGPRFRLIVPLDPLQIGAVVRYAEAFAKAGSREAVLTSIIELARRAALIELR